MQSAKKIDMTQGSIMPLIFRFALPLCIANILQQLYNTVDTLVVGNFCGQEALAAVGTSAFPVEMLLCIFLGIGGGTTILVSQYTGRGDTDGIKEIVSTATAFLYLCAIPLSIVGLFVTPAILKLMQVPADTWDYAVGYTRIIFLGTLGNMGYNMNAGILRGMGDSKSSLGFLIVSCITNIVLDLLFVIVFRMEVYGVALATIIAMFVSWILSIIYIKKNYPEMEFKIFSRRLNKKILKDILIVGVPLGLNNSIYSIGHIATQSLTNAQGSAFIAGCSISSKLTGIANIAVSSLSSAALTFSGQNFGAKNYIRLKKGSLRIPVVMGCISCAAGLIITFFGEPILRVFSDDADVLEMAMIYLRIVMPFVWMNAVFSVLLSYAKGIGEVRYSTVANLMMLWVVRIPVSYLVAYLFDGKYLMIGLPVSFFFGMTSMIIFFMFSKRWREILRLAAKQESGMYK